MTEPPQLVTFTRVKFDDQRCGERFSEPDPISWADNMEHNARLESSGWRDLRRRLSFAPSAAPNSSSSGGGGVAKSAARKTRSFSLLPSSRMGGLLFRGGAAAAVSAPDAGGELGSTGSALAQGEGGDVVVQTEVLPEAAALSTGALSDDDSLTDAPVQHSERVDELVFAMELPPSCTSTSSTSDMPSVPPAADTGTSLNTSTFPLPDVAAADPPATAAVDEVDATAAGHIVVLPEAAVVSTADTANNTKGGGGGEPAAVVPKKRESITSGLRRFSLKEALLNSSSGSAKDASSSPTSVKPLTKTSMSSNALLVPQSTTSSSSSRSSLSKSPLPSSSSSKKSVGKTVSNATGMSSPKPKTPISKTLSSLTTTFSRRTSNTSSSATTPPPPTNSFVLTQIVNLMLNTVMGKGFDFTGGKSVDSLRLYSYATT
jgi:hypothetical protein